LAAEIEAGSLVLDGHFVELDLDRIRTTGVSGFAAQLALGSVIVGALLAAVGALAAWALVGPRQPAPASALDGALERTISRYAGAAHGDRYYVAAKLHADPLLEQLEAQPGHFGRVVDIGCGRGQLGLFLMELGRVSALSGIDADERKVETARRAAGSDASFEVKNATDATIEPADTLLVIDVLHYLPPAEQAALLERAAASLSSGGRIFVRELDTARRWRAKPAMLAERIARAIGYNRGPALAFTTADAITSRLEGLGLRCRVDRSGSLSNVLIVAERPVTAA
jgi:2-polyprenyl-3-methyl-5-hydroxy-6-metoxy-1,4-benzoquinol methylase